MKVLAVNAGSSSLKFRLYEMPKEKELISGTFERIGIEDSFYTIKLNGDPFLSAKKIPFIDKVQSFGLDTLLTTLSDSPLTI